jgi:small-conductance mechanosensitive channel
VVFQSFAVGRNTWLTLLPLASVTGWVIGFGLTPTRLSLFVTVQPLGKPACASITVSPSSNTSMVT